MGDIKLIDSAFTFEPYVSLYKHTCVEGESGQWNGRIKGDTRWHGERVTKASERSKVLEQNTARRNSNIDRFAGRRPARQAPFLVRGRE